MPEIEINQLNLKSGIFNKYNNVIYSNSYWHKIIIENIEGLDRNTVLKTLMQFCHPHHLIPVCYESFNNTANFLLKNCGPAIEKMCSHNLIIINPFKKDKPVSLKLCSINSNDLKINIQDNVINVLNKRFNQENGVLNLENFAKDSDLEEYCALSQPKLLFYVLHLAKDINFKFLKLCYNDIENLKPMEALVSVKTLKAVDLRNNNIKSISEISSMRKLNITELWLDGNPLCDDYDEFTYSRAIKERLESVEKLDGVNIQSDGFLPFRRNFLCSQTGYDLVDQFLEHYFTLYDAQTRSVLDGIYHKEALFSITTNYLPLQSTSLSARLSVYKKISRNLLQISDFNKNVEFLFAGSQNILKILCSLPSTEHDPFSFTVDLVMYTEKMAVLVVCGVFREISEPLVDTVRLLSFTRTFVLLAGKNEEYSIINDIIHITNATTIQAARAFKHVKTNKPDYIYIPQPRNIKEMNEIEGALKALTGMNTEWARKCLEECKYDLKRALVLFVDLYKIDKFPSFAFENSEEISNSNKQMNIQNSDTRTILNQPHQHSGIQQPMNQPLQLVEGQPRPTMPHVGNMQAIFNRPTRTTENIQQISQPRFSIPNMINRLPMNPSVPIVSPVRNISLINQTRPTVPPLNNIRPQMNPPTPFIGNIFAIIPPRPFIRPNIQPVGGVQNQTSQVLNPFANKQKNKSRVSLVNINLKK